MVKGNGMMYHARIIYHTVGRDVGKYPTDALLRDIARTYVSGWPDTVARRVRELKLFKDLKIVFAQENDD